MGYPWRAQIEAAAIIWLIFAESSVFAQSDSLKNALVQWQGLKAIRGHVTTVGEEGFSTGPDAQIPSVVIKTVLDSSGKTVHFVGDIPDKSYPPVTKADWHLDSSGKFYIARSLSYLMPKNSVTPSPSDFLAESWDGQKYYEENGETSLGDLILAIHTGLPTLIKAFGPEPFLTNAFRFLSPTRLGDSLSQFPSLEKLQDPAIYARFYKEAKPLGYKRILDRDCLAFDIDGGVDAFSGEPIFYRVYLDPNEQYFPVAWDRFSSKNNFFCKNIVCKRSKRRHFKALLYFVILQTPTLFITACGQTAKRLKLMATRLTSII